MPKKQGSKPVDDRQAKLDDLSLLAYRYKLSETNSSEILSELRRLAGYATHPDNPNSLDDKDASARRALQLAGELIAPLVQWAINHHAGQVLNDIGPALPWRPHREQNAELKKRTTVRNLAANEHNNEKRGASYNGDDPKINRRLAARVLALISRGMTFAAGRQLAGALEALDQGETAAMLRPTRKGRRHQPASFDQVRLRALQHVEYRRGIGMSENRALDEIAKAFGRSPDAIKKWKTRLPETMDPDFVTEHLKLSWLAGMLFASLTDEQRRLELPIFQPRLNFDDPTTRQRIEKYAQDYGAAQLSVLAKRFKALDSAVKRKRIY